MNEQGFKSVSRMVRTLMDMYVMETGLKQHGHNPFRHTILSFDGYITVKGRGKQ